MYVTSRIPAGNGSLNGFTRPAQSSTTLDLISKLIAERLFFCQVTELYFDPHVRAQFPKLPESIQIDPKLGIFKVYYLNNSQEDPVNKISSWIQEYLSKHPVTFFDEKGEKRFQISIYCLKKLNISVSDYLPEHFSTEELKFLEINQKLVNRFHGLLSPQKLSCFEFALLNSHEVGVRELLFNWPTNETISLLAALPRWGYDVVTNPQEKDLVLYLNKGAPTHMGLLVSKTDALSKLGNDKPYYLRHPIELTWSVYGPHMVFYRKMREGRYQTILPVLEAAKSNKLSFTGEGL